MASAGEGDFLHQIRPSSSSVTTSSQSTCERVGGKLSPTCLSKLNGVVVVGGQGRRGDGIWKKRCLAVCVFVRAK